MPTAVFRTSRTASRRFGRLKNSVVQLGGQAAANRNLSRCTGFHNEHFERKRAQPARHHPVVDDSTNPPELPIAAASPKFSSHYSNQPRMSSSRRSQNAPAVNGVSHRRGQCIRTKRCVHPPSGRDIAAAQRVDVPARRTTAIHRPGISLRSNDGAEESCASSTCALHALRVGKAGGFDRPENRGGATRWMSCAFVQRITLPPNIGLNILLHFESRADARIPIERAPPFLCVYARRLSTFA